MAELIVQSILDRFAPEVRLHPDDNHRPASVDFYLERVVMTYGKDMHVLSPATSTGVTTANIDKFTYQGRSSGDAITGAEFRLKQRDDANVDRHTTRCGYNVESIDVPCYVHVNSARKAAGVFDLQYLMFYPYNGPTSDTGDYGGHEGDWEMVVVRIERVGDDYRLLAVNYLAHGNHAWYYPAEAGRSDRRFAVNADGRPIVYSAKGSHASYTASGKRDGDTQYSTDRTGNGPIWRTWHNVVRIVDDETGEALPGHGWVGYAGRWGGFRHRDLSDVTTDLGQSAVDEDGPRNPPYTDQWRTHESLSFWQIAGTLFNVSVGSDGAVWGVREDGAIYRHTGDVAAPWERMPGTLRRIDVGRSTRVWGANSQDQIYRWEPGRNTWERIDGALHHISVASDNTVWGIGEKDRIHRWSQGAWVRVDGALRQLSVGSAAHVWGVNDADDIYRRDVAAEKWIRVPGKLRLVTVDATGTEVWGLNSEHEIFRWDEASQTWTLHEGSLVTLSVGALGALWGVNSEGSIFRRAG